MPATRKFVLFPGTTGSVFVLLQDGWPPAGLNSTRIIPAGPGGALFALIAEFAGRYASTGTEVGAAGRGQPDLSGFEPVRYREAFGNEQFIAHPAM